MAINELNQEQLPKTEPSKASLYLLLFVVLVLLGIIGLLAYKYVVPAVMAAKMPIEPSKPKVSIPSNAVRISGCIANEGEHWVQPDKLPYGPFYVSYNDKVMAIEYMFTDKDIPGKDFAHMSPADAQNYMMQNHMSLSGLVNMLERPFSVPDASIKDWSMHWTPPHAGFVEPHYDVHFYLVDKAERDTVCPDSTFDQVLPMDVMQQLKSQGIAVPEAPPAQ